MAVVTVNENICQGCGLCVNACPKKIVELIKGRLNARGFHPAGVTKPEACTGCAFCAVMCPDVAIMVEK
ncbi:MAG: 4Fe-4S binding protein [Defluviitaleaceae bacterium]|nr:4Fe-4S binding protein [Defluviitaleaceae bacterium]